MSIREPDIPVPRLRHELTFRANIKNGRHGWLRLTPAYSLHLVEELALQGGGDQRVLDPFSGTGTTPLVCAQHGIRADSVDINPFLVWLGNLKLERFTDRESERFAAYVKNVLACSRALDPADLWLPDLLDIHKWWHEPQLLSLGRIIRAIRETSPPEGRFRSLALVAFCKASIECANVSFGHQSMSFKQPKEQLVSPNHTNGRGLNGVAAIFESSALAIGGSLHKNVPAIDNFVLLGDSRDLPAALGGRRYTTVITSPPYPNRMSYIRELRPYMYWLQFLRSGREAGELDWQAIGGTWGSATGNLASWKARTGVRVPFPGFAETVAAITAGHKLLGPYVAKYFEDIVLHVRSLRAVLEPRARLHYVVGNSKFYDVMLHTEAIYEAIFRSEGFTDTRIRTIRKRTSKKELFEYVVEATMP